MKSNVQTADWAQRYETALRRYLKQGPEARLQPALRLGRQAVALGLETLNVAVIHEQVLKQLEATERSAQAKRCLTLAWRLWIWH